MAKQKGKESIPQEKHAGGRPSKYVPEFHPLLAESLARNGLINPQIADRMGIATSTLSKWMGDYLEFSDAIKRGRTEPDDKVEASLLKRATGYRYQEVTKEVKGKCDDVEAELSVTKVVTKEVAPDPTSMIFWLKNRRPDRWRDKQEIEHSGTITDKLTKEERKARIDALRAKLDGR